jgi:hypothetical protein
MSAGALIKSISPFWKARTLSPTGIHSIAAAAGSGPQ